MDCYNSKYKKGAKEERDLILEEEEKLLVEREQRFHKPAKNYFSSSFHSLYIRLREREGKG